MSEGDRQADIQTDRYAGRETVCMGWGGGGRQTDKVRTRTV